jgi:hypothetical protein
VAHIIAQSAGVAVVRVSEFQHNSSRIHRQAPFHCCGAAFILCFALRNSVCVVCKMSRVVYNVLVEASALIRAVVFP